MHDRSLERRPDRHVSGAIGHSGGLSLTKSGTTTSATDFDISLSASPTLAALINGALPKAGVEHPPGGRDGGDDLRDAERRHERLSAQRAGAGAA